MVRQGVFGLSVILSALTCGCTSISNGSAPAIMTKPPLTGDATGFTYELSDKEKKFSCKKLTGVMQVRILQMRGMEGPASSSLAARSLHSVSQTVFGAKARAGDPEEQYTQDHAMLEAYNRQLAAKKCKSIDISAELKAVASTNSTPASKRATNNSQNKKP